MFVTRCSLRKLVSSKTCKFKSAQLVTSQKAFASQKSPVPPVHVAVGYTSPFEDGETVTILQRVNEASKTELEKFTSKTRAAQIAKFKDQEGPFVELGQLLGVQGIGQTALEKMGDAILKSMDPSAVAAAEEAAKRKKQSKSNPATRTLNQVKKMSKHVRPPLNAATARSVKTVCAVKMTARAVAWVQFDVSSQGEYRQRLVDWDVYEFGAHLGHTWGKIDHQAVYRLAQALLDSEGQKSLPNSDIYVFEEMIGIDKGKPDPYLPIKIQLLELQASLIALINSSIEKADSSEFKGSLSLNLVYIMKYAVIDTLFNLKVGSERVVLTGEKFLEIVQQNPSRAASIMSTVEEERKWPESFRLDLTERHLEKLRNGSLPNEEQMALACLNGLAFTSMLDVAMTKKEKNETGAYDGLL